MRHTLSLLAAAACLGIVPASAAGGDCNSNGIPDADDLLPRFALEASSVFPAGKEPAAIIAADLDGDGFPDLAAANRASGDVTIAHGPGLGRPAAPISYSLRESPIALAALDLDGDGDLDLAAAGGRYPDPGWFSVLENGGGGSFDPAVEAGAASSPSALLAADLNGDGRPDLALSDRGEDGIFILRNLGEGALERSPLLPAGSVPVAMAAADLDGDSDIDLAASAELSNGISVLWNSGADGFTPAPLIRGGRVPAGLAAGDLDGDGIADLVAAYRASMDLRAFHGARDGVLRAGSIIALPDEAAGLALADLDGDSDLDLAALANLEGENRPTTKTALRRSALLIFAAEGDGSFGEGRTLSVARRRSPCSPRTSTAMAGRTWPPPTRAPGT